MLSLLLSSEIIYFSIVTSHSIFISLIKGNWMYNWIGNRWGHSVTKITQREIILLRDVFGLWVLRTSRDSSFETDIFGKTREYSLLMIPYSKMSFNLGVVVGWQISPWKPKFWKWTLSFNQSIDQPSNHPSNQPSNQSIGQSIYQPIDDTAIVITVLAPIDNVACQNCTFVTGKFSCWVSQFLIWVYTYILKYWSVSYQSIWAMHIHALQILKITLTFMLS